VKSSIFYALVVLLAGCGSGTIIMQGDNKRDPVIDESENIALYYTPPAHYEVIGVVTGKGKGGLFHSDQSMMGDAVEEMKDQARDAGATGVLLQSSGLAEAGRINTASATVNGGAVFGVGTSVPIVEGEVSGQAIYVPEDAAAFIKAKAVHQSKCDAMDAKEDSLSAAEKAAKKSGTPADVKKAEQDEDDLDDAEHAEYCGRDAWYADQMQAKQALMDKMRAEDQAAQDKDKDATEAEKQAQCLAAAKANDLATWRKLGCT
jgi:hypothetical protein